ncbi:helix-turn-helix domain-containing protein [Streptomyces avermitilis]|uniref:helix-turn-helix domain-containing protein n=1 Tax=Streptomyces avermitilis TaxID=33903 RepID=UPI003819F546
MSARPAPPHATLRDLTPAQVRIVNKVADGQSTEAIASDLKITAGTINVQMKHCGQKLGVSGRAAVVHACFVTGQLQRPEKSTFLEAFSDAEITTWRMVAAGATSKDYAENAFISRDEALRRVRGLRGRVKADNDPRRRYRPHP